jgi:hypothetical protein
MGLIEHLEEFPLSDLVRYRSGAPQDAVAFVGTLRKHPYEKDKCILISEDADAEPAVFEFRKADVIAVEEMPSPVDETGASRSVAKLWVRRGSVGLRYQPFEVDEPLRFRGSGRRLRERIMVNARGWS